MSYQASKGSTFASLSLTGAPLLGAVGSIVSIPFAVAATPSEDSVPFGTTLPKGTWVGYCTFKPTADTAGASLVNTQIYLGHSNPGAADTIVFDIIQAGASNSCSAPLYVDGTQYAFIRVAGYTSAGTWSVPAASYDNVVYFVKIA